MDKYGLQLNIRAATKSLSVVAHNLTAFWRRSAPLSKGFRYFTKRPPELRDQIWQYCADAWIYKHAEYIWWWTVANQRIFHVAVDDVEWKYPNVMGRMDLRGGYVIHLPDLLFVCRESRAVMYDALLSFNSKEPVPRGEDIHLFLTGAGDQPDVLHAPQIYGWRVQDFRYEGLQRRVEEEKERLEIMREELGQVAMGGVVDPDKRAETYVRLPLFQSRAKYVRDDGEMKKIWLYPSSYHTEGQGRPGPGPGWLGE